MNSYKNISNNKYHVTIFSRLYQAYGKYNRTANPDLIALRTLTSDRIRRWRCPPANRRCTRLDRWRLHPEGRLPGRRGPTIHGSPSAGRRPAAASAAVAVGGDA